MKTVASAVIASIGLIICFALLSNAYKYKFKANETISVTGLAEKEFTSDEIVWSGSFTRKNMDLKAVYASIKSDEKEIRAYLLAKGIKDNEMVFSSITINKDFDPKYENGKAIGQQFTGYTLTQSVTVDSKDIDKVEKISREITELIEKGIEFNSTQPSYYYTQLSKLKLDLLANAAADARQRAQIIAKNSGSDLGSVRVGNMGVFQITGQNSNEDYSYGGAFNTSAKDKKASITVKMEYAVK